MDKFEVEFYTKDNGEKPAKDFILSLDVKMRAKILGIIKKTQETPKREIKLAKLYREEYLERVINNE